MCIINTTEKPLKNDISLSFFFISDFLFFCPSSENERNVSRIFNILKGNDRLGGSRHYDFVPHDLISMLFVGKGATIVLSTVFRLDYKVKPVVISTNLLAI